MTHRSHCLALRIFPVLLIISACWPWSLCLIRCICNDKKWKIMLTTLASYLTFILFVMFCKGWWWWWCEFTVPAEPRIEKPSILCITMDCSASTGIVDLRTGTSWLANRLIAGGMGRDGEREAHFSSLFPFSSCVPWISPLRTLSWFRACH